jgi:hypothetical protein
MVKDNSSVGVDDMPRIVYSATLTDHGVVLSLFCTMVVGAFYEFVKLD